jgi:hypothetical protein
MIPILGALGLISSAGGAIASAFGADKAAKAAQQAAYMNVKDENALYDRQSGLLNELIADKKEKLYDIGNIFDRFESTGAFGDTDTLKNLRTAQSDFSKLAAGDFSGFEAQLRKSMSDALISTVGSGSPVGAYAQLAADTQMAYRKEGIATSMGISEYLSNESFKLLGQEFGVMDQGFEVGYQLDRTKTSNIANYRMQSAAQEGVGLTAFGNAAMQIGGVMTSMSNFNTTSGIQSAAYGVAKGITQGVQPSQKTYGNTAPTYYKEPSLPSYSDDNWMTNDPFVGSDVNPNSNPILPRKGDVAPENWVNPNAQTGYYYSQPALRPVSTGVNNYAPYIQQQQYVPSSNQNYVPSNRDLRVPLPDGIPYYAINGSYSSVLASIGASVVS